MAVRTFGINGSSETPESYRLATSGLWVPASALNVRSGVTSVPVLTGTGSFTCTVGPFNCVVDGTSNSLQGGYAVALDAATTVTINAASTQARIDLISLQVQDNDYDGSGQHQGVVVYTAGTPGSGVAPTAPANSISLFTVPVAANASSVNFASATSVFPYTAAAGGIVPARNSTDKPAVVGGVQYRHRLDVTAAAGSVTPLESSTDGVTYTPVFDPNGFAWQTFATAWTAATTNPSLGNGYLLMRYMKIGKIVFIQLNLTMGSTTTYGTGGQWAFSLPFTPVASLNGRTTGMIMADAAGITSLGVAQLYTTGKMFPNVNGSYLDATHPNSWGSADILMAFLFYETA